MNKQKIQSNRDDTVRQENLFAYTDVNYNYSVGKAGAIYGARNATAANLSAVKEKIGGLNGDPAFFNFFQGRNSRLVLRQYTYSTTDLRPNRIIAPQGAWVPSLQEKTWNDVANLHGVATYVNWLFATGYDLANIAVVDMDDDFKQKRAYNFPTDITGFTNPYSDGKYHGEALTVVGNKLYALFYVNQGSGYTTYYDSIVARFGISATSGQLTYEAHVTTGKNSFTLDLHNNKLYVCSVGGMQHAGHANADTNLCIIDLSNFTQSGVTTVTLPTGVSGDFRDISILNDNHVYIMTGYYDGNYKNLIGNLYHTTIANITSPSNWTTVTAINDEGYLWGIHADEYRLWFVKGTPIAIYDGTPTGTATADRVFSISDMSNQGSDGHLNSACFIAPNLPATREAPTTKSLASHIRLAREARMLAEEKR